MIIRKAYKYRLKTHSQQIESLFYQFAGCNRFVWNKALALQKESLEGNKKILSYNDLASNLVGWKKNDETSFLKTAPSQPLQQTLKNLDRALKDAFDKKQPNKKFPKFKKRGFGDSFKYPQGFKFQDNQIFLPKIGWVKYFNSREIEGTPKNVTVSRKGKYWFASIQVELDLSISRHPSGKIVGIDLGISRFATLSNGTVISPLNSFKKTEKKLAKVQKDLARKEKFSNNWKKQKRKVQNLHIKIADTRKDFLHKKSASITNENQVVILEDLKVSNMSKSAKGTAESPGKNVNAKSGLNKAILDQGWSEFRRQIEYKLNWLGGQMVLVNPRNTSRKCSVCGHTCKENRTTQSTFFCVECGHTQNADLNASLNILAAGHVVLACGDIKLVTA